MIIVWILHVPSVSEVTAWISDCIPQISRNIYVYVWVITAIILCGFNHFTMI